jgi:hypothetical protein
LMMMKTEAQLYFSDSRRLEVTTVKGIGEWHPRKMVDA